MYKTVVSVYEIEGASGGICTTVLPFCNTLMFWNGVTIIFMAVCIGWGDAWWN
jgi:hypothetical protein